MLSIINFVLAAPVPVVVQNREVGVSGVDAAKDDTATSPLRRGPSESTNALPSPRSSDLGYWQEQEPRHDLRSRTDSDSSGSGEPGEPSNPPIDPLANPPRPTLLPGSASTSRLPTSQAPAEEIDPLNPGSSGNTDLNTSPEPPGRLAHDIGYTSKNPIGKVQSAPSLWTGLRSQLFENPAPPPNLLGDPPRWLGTSPSRLNPAATIDLFNNPSTPASRLPPSSWLGFGSQLHSWSPSTSPFKMLFKPQLPASQAPTVETDPLNPGPSSLHGNRSKSLSLPGPRLTDNSDR